VDYRPGISREELLSLVSGYDVLVVRSRTRVDRELIDRAASLKLVARPGTGLDNIDVEYARSRGIEVLNSPESLVEAVAEHVVLLMLSLSRRVVEASLSTKSGLWEKERFTGYELRGKTLGIVGMGKIGRRVGELCSVFGMSILGYDVVPVPREVVEKLKCSIVDLDTLFSSSDYVTLHVPLTRETSRMVGKRLLSLMKSGSFLVNTSRGGVVDEAELAEALKAGRIAGAGLDVFESEPPSGPILSAPNTVLTPHIGGQTVEAQADAIRVVGRKIAEFFRAG
jgi:D-3-phosphoglycerate dehydrogenase